MMNCSPLTYFTIPKKHLQLSDKQEFLYNSSTLNTLLYHIDNDGYNCNEDNLIMLTEIQHGAIHKNEMKEE